MKRPPQLRRDCLVAGVLCSCAPLYGKSREMMESAAGLGREKVAETREERNVGQWPFGETGRPLWPILARRTANGTMNRMI